MPLIPEPPPVPTSEELVTARERYEERVLWDLTYRACLDSLARARNGESHLSEAEAVELLLRIWNSIYYQKRPAKRESLRADLQRLLEAQAEALEAFRGRSIDSLTEADHEPVCALFEAFSKVLDPAGASKALHLLAPEFFPAWDSKIARRYHVDRSAQGYWDYLVTFREICGEIADRVPPGANPVKALDEFNVWQFTRGGDLDEDEG